MTVQRMPAAEVDVSVELVRQLLAEQHPDLAGLALGVLANGWDNMVCTVGADLLARLPRRALAAELVAHEQRCMSRRHHRHRSIRSAAALSRTGPTGSPGTSA